MCACDVLVLSDVLMDECTQSRVVDDGAVESEWYKPDLPAEEASMAVSCDLQLRLSRPLL